MTWDGVPWSVNGGLHATEVARLLAYAAVGGAEGVIGAGDCKVTASAIADGNVHIAPGGVALLNRFAGGGQQAYLGRNISDEVKAMTPQGSSGVRYDLVCVILQDPEYAGQPAPVSVPNGPYLKTMVYENVPATTTMLSQVAANQTGLALARVKFDASDGTVTAADITDLRQMVQARRKTVKKVALPVSTVALPGAYGTAPSVATWAVDIPTWATRVILEGVWGGVVFTDTSAGAGNATGGARVTLGTIITDATSFQADATASNKPVTQALMAAGDLAVPSALRGTTQNLTAQLAKTGGAGMTASTTAYTTCLVTATFYEDVE